MTEFLRILLLLALAGALITGVAAWHGWWNEETRRLTRVIRAALGGDPDAQIIAHGQNAAAAFRLDTEQVLVMRDGGGKALLYPMAALLGAELIVDQGVAARVHRGEPRRAMDVVRPAVESVVLRLLFDDPRDPDFELNLPPDAVGEARTWLARAEAITRWPGRQPNVTAPAPVAAVRDEEDEDEEPPF
jgi:hypothetical protein